MPTTPSGKVQLRQLGELMPPGNCALCGGSTPDRQYVDIMLYIDLHGQIYFCTTCVAEIIDGTGGMDKFSADVIKAQMDEARRLVQSYAEENEGLKNDLNGIRRSLGIDTLPSRGYRFSDPTLFDESTEQEQGNGTTVRPVVDGDGKESKSPEPTKEPGRKSVKLLESSDGTALGL